MTTIIKGDDPRITISGLTDVLGKIGLVLPESVTTTPQHVTVPDPDSAEIVAAIKAADGDPAADATVQRLITARAIARGGYLDLLAHAARKDQWSALTAALDTINDQIHDVFATAASEIEAVAPELKGYPDLDSLVLASLPARVADPARRAVNAQHTLRAAHAAWLKLWRSVGGQQTGRPEADILAVCNPTPTEWLEHASRRPQSLPAPGDVWTMARNGWPLSLAHDLRDAKARAEHIRTTLDRESEKRRLEKGRATSWGLYR
jgi:hypothetical protein